MVSLLWGLERQLSHTFSHTHTRATGQQGNSINSGLTSESGGGHAQGLLFLSQRACRISTSYHAIHTLPCHALRAANQFPTLDQREQLSHWISSFVSSQLGNPSRARWGEMMMGLMGIYSAFWGWSGRGGSAALFCAALS